MKTKVQDKFWNDPDKNTWGVTNCPTCRGLGLIDKISDLKTIFTPEESICPVCPFYRNNELCKAWVVSDDFFPSGEWIFIRENACDEIHRIINLIDSLVFRVGNNLSSETSS